MCVFGSECVERNSCERQSLSAQNTGLGISWVQTQGVCLEGRRMEGRGRQRTDEVRVKNTELWEAEKKRRETTKKRSKSARKKGSLCCDSRNKVYLYFTLFPTLCFWMHLHSHTVLKLLCVKEHNVQG